MRITTRRRVGRHRDCRSSRHVDASGRGDCYRLLFKGGGPMTQWKGDQLDKVGRAEEVQIASIRRDGTLRKPVTIWAVRQGDDLYVRSVRGRSGNWFRGTQEIP